MGAITGLRALELGVSSLELSTRFYVDVWGLNVVSEHDGLRYLRAAGPAHHALALREVATPRFIAAELAAADATAVERLHAKALTSGLKVLFPPRAIANDAGGGFGFALQSPDGLELKVTSGSREHGDVVNDRSRPMGITHYVVNSPNRDRESAFYQDLFGFRLSDATHPMHFLRCSAYHHTVAVASGRSLSLNHVAFEMQDFDGLMRGCGRVVDVTPIEWGVGRHGPGDNIFAYFLDPDGFAIEYTTGMQRIDESEHVPGTPQYWSEFPKRPCRWGLARKRSERLNRSMAGLPGGDAQDSRAPRA
ncbi:MAG TPA: VOC family protein [Caldimonas sp.]|nr:VOC family protein [Caldimonas sp.]